MKYKYEVGDFVLMYPVQIRPYHLVGQIVSRDGLETEYEITNGNPLDATFWVKEEDLEKVYKEPAKTFLDKLKRAFA